MQPALSAPLPWQHQPPMLPFCLPAPACPAHWPSPASRRRRRLDTPLSLSRPASETSAFRFAPVAVSGNGITFNSQTIQCPRPARRVAVFFSVTGVPTQQHSCCSCRRSLQPTRPRQRHLKLYENNNNSTFGLGNSGQRTTRSCRPPGRSSPLTAGRNGLFVNSTRLSLLGCGTQPSGVCTANLTIDLSSSAVPEPASLAILGIGVLGIAFVASRRRDHSTNTEAVA